MSNNEKIFKTMQLSGALNIAIGIVSIVIGLAAGVGGIIIGASLLKKKNDITF